VAIVYGTFALGRAVGRAGKPALQLAGPADGIPASVALDQDGDNDLDLTDFAAFQANFVAPSDGR
jgi:hypothetical protein